MKIEPGIRVKQRDTGECGVIVYSWYNNELEAEDYYVAFFGDSFPKGKPEDTPYVLRYAASSLEVIS